MTVDEGWVAWAEELAASEQRERDWFDQFLLDLRNSQSIEDINIAAGWLSQKLNGVDE